MSVRADSEFVETRKSFVRRWVTPITASAVLLALTTTLVWALDVPLHHDHLIFIYFMPTALIAIRYGSVSAMGVAMVAAVAAAFLFYAPRFSFLVRNPLDLLELVLFGLLALLACQVVSGFAQDRDIEKRRRRVREGSLRARWPRMAALWDRLGF